MSVKEAVGLWLFNSLWTAGSEATNFKSQISNHRFRIADFKTQISNHRLRIADFKSQISKNLQSAICNLKFSRFAKVHPKHY